MLLMLWVSRKGSPLSNRKLIFRMQVAYDLLFEVNEIINKFSRIPEQEVPLSMFHEKFHTRFNPCTTPEK